MPTTRVWPWLGLGVLVLVGSVPARATQDDVQRTIYVTARDARGQYVGSLAPGDLLVKEAGRERVPVRVQPSDERLRVALVLDELLAPNAFVRQALLAFVKRLRERGDLALHVVGTRHDTRVDYTSEFYPFLSAINALPARAPYPGNLVAALIQIVKYQRPLEGRRAVVVMAPEIAQPSNVTAEGVFDELRDGGAVMHAATFVGWQTGGAALQQVPATRLEGGDLTQVVERDRVLSDGPKRSGGLTLQATRPEVFAAILDQIGDELLHEYRVTYLVPRGTKSDGRVSVGSTRRGVTLRGPTRLPSL